MPNREPVIVSKAVFDGLEAIRKSGKVNMMEWRRVQAIADNKGYYDLVVWLQDHQAEYLTGFSNGFTTEEEIKRKRDNEKRKTSGPTRQVR